MTLSAKDLIFQDTKHPKLTRSTPSVWKQRLPSGPQLLTSAMMIST